MKEGPPTLISLEQAAKCVAAVNSDGGDFKDVRPDCQKCFGPGSRQNMGDG
jgi:hypothetical protein